MMCPVSTRYFCTSKNLPDWIVGSGFSWPSTAPWLSARYNSPKFIGVGFAPQASAIAMKVSTSGTRSLKPFMSSTDFTALEPVVR